MRPLSRGDVSVFPLGLGGMPLSIAGRPDEAQSIATVHAALDAGMTLIDTADVYCQDETDYGHNERLIAKALRQWGGNRSWILVATKGGLRRPKGAWTRDARPESLKAACEASLRALGVDAVDLYQLHAPDEKVPFVDSVGALEDLRRAGKVRRIGLSNVTVAQIREARAITRVWTVQNRFSPFFREALTDGVIAHCEKEGIGFLAYSPVGGGRLHKKLPAHPEVAAIARVRGVGTHQVVLAWVMAASPCVIPIPGASRPESARGSAAAAGLALTREERARIDAAVFSTE